MTVKTLLSTTALLAALTLGAPAFAAGNDASDMGKAPSAGSSDLQNNQAAPPSDMNNASSVDTQAEKPAMRRHIARSHASDGMDVAPGGGVYSRADVGTEDPDRMSHPVVGEAKAPSNAASGDLAQVEQTEREQTANLNAQQLGGMPQQTANAPNQ